MPVASYSQCGEDLQIAYLLGYKKPVAYIDVGCLWPKDHSNSFYFYERGGSGLCIDPNPDIAAGFRVERPRDTLITCGIADRRGEMSYYRYENPVFNTLSEERAQALEREVATGHRGRRLVSQEVVPVMTLDDAVAETAFADRHPEEFDFLSVDVEGMEMAVLRGFGFVPRPRVIVVERLRHGRDRSNGSGLPITEFLSQRGYWLSSYTGHDLYFVSE